MKGETMSTWLMDTALFKMLATPKAKPLLQWCEANDASLYISAASLTEIALGINKLPGSHSQRADAEHSWLNEIITRFADRIHPVDAAIATRAGESLLHLTIGARQSPPLEVAYNKNASRRRVDKVTTPAQV
jgi:predicted nucleic acid-binding protein